MVKQDFNRGWRFTSPDAEGGIVDLPHDFSIIQKRTPDAPAGRGNGFFQCGTGSYEKSILIPEDWKGKTVILEFEGVYMNATVRFNGTIVAQQPYGYTSFHCDLTPWIKYGEENVVNVHVNNSMLPNNRWYSGSGIYRPVWLMVGDSVHIIPWGVYATTPKVSPEESVVSVKTTIRNHSSCNKEVTLRSTLISGDRSVAATVETVKELPADSVSDVEQMISVSPAQLWSVAHPYLYRLKSEILSGSTVVDESEMQIGIRSISFDSKEGFLLNGVKTMLKGGNVHHDCGIIGAAAYERAEERKVELLKASGFNAVRCSHNPPSPYFLDACDRLGMFVMDEAFDCWREEKLPNDYHLFFNEWWERDLAAMVLRDRNHPSVIMWSTGNEIIEKDGRSDGYILARKLADFVRSLDSTRAVTNGINEMFRPVEEFAAPLDVVGYNYEMGRYEQDAINYPERVICATENYIKETFEYWMNVERYPNVIGDFYWTAMDYLGEAGVGKAVYVTQPWSADYPWHMAYCGDIDVCGFKRPQSYYRDCVWGISKAPYIAVYRPEYYGVEVGISGWAWHNVVHSWAWPEYVGKPVIVEVYSTDEEVELFLDGRSLGRKQAGKANQYIASFELNYDPGELKAVAYSNGAETASSVLKTAGKPASLRLTPDRSCLKAKFGDLSYVTVELLDSDGNLVSNADNEIFFSVCGAGKILAVGNSNPVSEEMYVGNHRRLHEGRAMVVLCCEGQTGSICLTAMTDGISPAQVEIDVKADWFPDTNGL